MYLIGLYINYKMIHGPYKVKTIFVFNLNGDVENPNKTSVLKYLFILAFHGPHSEFPYMGGLTLGQLSMNDNRRTKNSAYCHKQNALHVSSNT